MVEQSPIPPKHALLRQRLWEVMHKKRGRLGRAFNFLLITLILFSVAILPLEFLPRFSGYAQTVHVIEAFIVAVFTVEYCLRIYAAPSRLRYIFSFFGIVDLLSIMPFYAGVFGTEYVRVLRLIRFFKLAEIEAGAAVDEEAVRQKGIGLVDGENVEYVVTKHPLVLIFGSIPPIFAFMFAIGIFIVFEANPIAIAASLTLFIFGFVFLWKAWLDYSYDVIYITNLRLIFVNQHILGRSINQISYSAITNVKPHYPGILSYLFGFGSLVIDTAAEHPGQIGLHMVRSHEKAAQIIMQKGFTKQPQQDNPIL